MFIKISEANNEGETRYNSKVSIHNTDSVIYVAKNIGISCKVVSMKLTLTLEMCLLELQLIEWKRLQELDKMQLWSQVPW